MNKCDHSPDELDESISDFYYLLTPITAFNLNIQLLKNDFFSTLFLYYYDKKYNYFCSNDIKSLIKFTKQTINHIILSINK